MAVFVDLHVTNIDQSIPNERLCPLLHDLLAEVGGVSVHNLHIYRHGEEGWGALAKLGSMQEAQKTKALLDGRQVGEQKINVEVDSLRAVPLPQNVSCKVKAVRCNCHLPGKSYNLKGREQLPCVLVNLGELGRNVKKLVADHGGSIPLASLPHCYALQFPPLLAVPGEEGVPLEHLLQAVQNVAMTRGGVGGVKKLVDTSTGPKEYHCNGIGPPPSLANQLITFSKEVVDLLRAAPACRLPLYKFIPSYQLMFGKQCNVADYGYTKLNDLLDSLEVVQTLGEGARASITISHAAQVKRFTNDLLKVLKLQPEKQLLLSHLPEAFSSCFRRNFDIVSYGVCYVVDMLEVLPEGTVLLEKVTDDDCIISVFKRNQTREELARVKIFAKEVTELLRHSSNFTIDFTKFIPAYHQYFGRQCRVSSYGVAKLAEVFECIPNTVEVMEVGEERVVMLSQTRLMEAVGEQVENVVKQVGRDKGLPLHLLESEYEARVGQKLPMARLNTTDVREMVDLLHAFVRLGKYETEEVVTPVDRSYIKSIGRKARQILLEQEGWMMALNQFKEQMVVRFGSEISDNSLMKDLGNLLEVRNGVVGLVPLQRVGKQIEDMLGGQKLQLTELQRRFHTKWGALPLQSLGLANFEDLLLALPEIFTLQGRGARRTVTSMEPAHPPTVSASSAGFASASFLLRPTVAAFSGRGFDMLRLINPPPLASNRSQDYRPPFPQQGPNPSLLQCHSSLPTPATPPQRTLSHEFSPRVPVELINPCWSSPSISSPLTFQQHMLRLSPSPLIVHHTSSPFLVQPIARQITSHHKYGDSLIKTQ